MSQSENARSSAARKRQAKPASVTEKRVRGADGKMTIFRTIDSASPTFGEDFLYIFRKNVAKARRENKRLIGTADGLVPKH